MTEPDLRRPLTPWVWILAAAVVILHLAVAGRYGIFRDEYYYLLCADHPAWGYVDHPPLAMVFLAVWKKIFGASVLALRVPPALLNGGVALGAALLAREMRGGRAAQVLATVVVALLPGVLALGGFYSMNAFDVGFWALTAFVVCRLLDQEADRRWWWGLGLAVGLGLLNKYSMAFLGVGIGVGILLSPLRREILTRHFWIAVGIVVILDLPHLVWQIRQGFPTLEFISNAHNLKNVAMSPGDFWGEQLLMAHPGFLPVWVIGVISLLALPRLRTWRPLGVAFVVVGIWLTISHAKPYYLVPAYPMVMAAGAVVITDWLGRWPRISRVTVIALPILMAVQGLVIAPLTIPLVSAEKYVSYEQTLGLRPKNMENNEVGDLPQHFADRFGWREMAAAVNEVIATIPEVERNQILVVTGNYGECGAINYWGLPEGVRSAVSGHNSCFTWWPDDFVPGIVVRVGRSRESLEEVYESVELGTVHRNGWAMPFQQEMHIWICRGWKVDPMQARLDAKFAI